MNEQDKPEPPLSAHMVELRRPTPGGGELVTYVNLSSVEGRCAAARWLAERLGGDPGHTAPLWVRVQNNTNGHGQVRWELRCADSRVFCFGFIKLGVALTQPDVADTPALAAAALAAAVAWVGADNAAVKVAATRRAALAANGGA